MGVPLGSANGNTSSESRPTMAGRRTGSTASRIHRDLGQLKFRRATPSDWKVLVDHRHRMFAEIGGKTARQLSAHDRLYLRWMKPRIRSGELVSLVIDTPDHGIVASGAIWFRPEQPRPETTRLDVPYLLSMYTEPEFRGRGLARRIVQEAVRICRRRGCRRVVLHAAPRARRLYEKAGFERTWEMRRELPG
jgi:GNAT superfamily N-acetyltransferase